MGILLAAEAWGVPPWQIAKRGRVTERQRIRWYLRYQEYRRLMVKKLNGPDAPEDGGDSSLPGNDSWAGRSE